MALDDADNVRHFISQMKGQSQKSKLTEVTPPSTPLHNQGGYPSNVDTEGAKTPPPTTFHGQDPDHPKPSPDISGLTAPQNTPKTLAWSPFPTAIDLHNQHVADAFSDYVNALIGRPLSESIWAPGSARRKPSMLSGKSSGTYISKSVFPVC